MSSLFQTHAEQLAQFAEATEERARENPDDWLLQSIAANQREAADEAKREYALSLGLEGSELIEWRLIGARLTDGEVPLTLLARLADPLNKLLIRAAYFARNHQDPEPGQSDDLSSELDLRLVGVTSGSARLFIRGSALRDMTGMSALSDAIANLMAALQASHDFPVFYERLADLGERASASLFDTFKALEMEDCALKVDWHRPQGELSWEAGREQVSQIRLLLEESKSTETREGRVTGSVTLLSDRGRLQVTSPFDQKITVRYNPKVHGTFVEKLHLHELVDLPVLVKIGINPVTGYPVLQYRLHDFQIEDSTGPQLLPGPKKDS